MKLIFLILAAILLFKVEAQGNDDDDYALVVDNGGHGKPNQPNVDQSQIAVSSASENKKNSGPMPGGTTMYPGIAQDQPSAA